MVANQFFKDVEALQVALAALSDFVDKSWLAACRQFLDDYTGSGDGAIDCARFRLSAKFFNIEQQEQLENMLSNCLAILGSLPPPQALRGEAGPELQTPRG
jgi:hypothetical protein